MSLINDALKTAQRERSGRGAPGSSNQPLLEGFFPYVSTSSPSGKSRSKVILIASISTVVVLAVGAFAAMPAIRRALAARSRESTPPLKPLQNAMTPPPVSTATPSEAGVVAAVDTTATETVVADPPPAPAGRRTARNVPQADPVVRAVDPTSTRSDTTLVSGGVQISQAPSARPRNESSRVDYEAEATALFNAGDLVGARERFQLATRYSPTARAWTNYGVTLQKLGDLRGARSAYQAAIGIDATYLEAWLFNARVAMELRETQVAIPLLQRALSINPRHAGVNADLAQLESDAQNWTESRKFAEEALRGEPANPRGHWYLAIAADQLKDVDVAVREYTAYLQTIGAGAPENAAAVGYARERLELLRKKP